MGIGDRKGNGRRGTKTERKGNAGVVELQGALTDENCDT